MNLRQLHNGWVLPAAMISAICLASCGCGGQDERPSSSTATRSADSKLSDSTSEAADMDDSVMEPDAEQRMKSGDHPAEMAGADAAESPGRSVAQRGGKQNQPDDFSGFGTSPESEAAPLAPAPGMKGGRRSVASEPSASARDRAIAVDSFKEMQSPSLGDRGIKSEQKTGQGRPFGFEQAVENKPGTPADGIGQAAMYDLQPGEELWIIAKAANPAQQTPDPQAPGCGALMATLPNQTQAVPVPLKHTAVTGNIDGYIATVDVVQQFHNPYDSKIEAVYVFPLPQSAAVNEFVMTVGERKIRGIIREREKAEQIYAAARSQGHVAALMTQERANIFTQKVANIEPGKQIDINIRYFNTLQYDDGSYEFVFPMVVGPRYNPPATTDGVGAAVRGQSGSSGQQTEVQYLAPSERSGHDISVSLNISAGVEVEDVHSVNHAVDVKNVSETQRSVNLTKGDSIPNKDFVLRYKVAGDHIKTAMMTHKDDYGQYFTMMLYPPADLAQVQRSPMEMVFVLDCSGSMKGLPMTQAKDAIRHALQSLTPRDTFQIIRFSNNASQLGAEPVVATEQNIQRGLEYVASLSGSGGTQMIEGIKAALDFPHDEGRFRLVSFMTDGYIGNEQQILSTMSQKMGASRIFSFGVGSSPNRMLMDRMAIIGRGAVTYLSLNDDATEIMDRFNRRISHPAMTDLDIDWGNMEVADVYPQRLPDLIVGRPVVVTGRFRGEPGIVKVNGRVGMEPASFAVALGEEDASASHKGIAAVWARLKIKDMMNDATRSPEAFSEIKSSVIETALAYNLMSSYTAFVAVDSMSKTEGDFGTTVAVPVPVPDGVQYETTVGGDK